jgi:hypothetical protein
MAVRFEAGTLRRRKRRVGEGAAFDADPGFIGVNLVWS